MAFSMFGQLRPRKPGSARSGAKRPRAIGRELSRASGGSAPDGYLLGKFLQRRVPRFAGLARPKVALDRLQRLQMEDELGVDRVRVAPQGLDAGYAQPRGRSATSGAAPAFGAGAISAG